MPLAMDNPFQDAESVAELSVRKVTCMGMWPTGRTEMRVQRSPSWANSSHAAMKCCGDSEAGNQGASACRSEGLKRA